MRRLFVTLAMLALLVGAALLVLGLAIHLPGDGIHLIVNDNEVHFAHPAGWHAVVGGLAVLFALCIAALVVPLTLVLAVLMPLLLVLAALALVVGVVLGVGAIALAPLLLPLVIVLWLWRRWLWRRSRRHAAGTTMGAMSPPGRPKGEARSAQHEGTPP